MVNTHHFPTNAINCPKLLAIVASMSFFSSDYTKKQTSVDLEQICLFSKKNFTTNWLQTMVSCPLGGTRIRTGRPSGIGRFLSCLGGSQWRGQYHQSWVMMRGSSQNIKCHIFNPCLVPSHKLITHFPPKLVGYMNFQTLPACNTRIPLGTSSAWQNPPGFFPRGSNQRRFRQSHPTCGYPRPLNPQLEAPPFFLGSSSPTEHYLSLPALRNLPCIRWWILCPDIIIEDNADWLFWATHFRNMRKSNLMMKPQGGIKIEIFEIT